jgi:hypothetical protein
MHSSDWQSGEASGCADSVLMDGVPDYLIGK